MKILKPKKNNLYTVENYCPKYMYCYQKAKWNIEKISKQSNANGYIVQLVKMKIEITNNLKKSKKYFEAWKVENGQIQLFDNNGYDDVFLVGKSIYDSFNELKMSIGNYGKSCFKGTVFWIDKSDNIYKDICKWKISGVEEAKELQSIEYSKELEKDLKKRFYFKRKSFVHKWNMIKGKDIFKITSEYLYKMCDGYSIKLKKKKLDNLIKDLFSKEYYAIKQEVLKEVKKQLQIEDI